MVRRVRRDRWSTWATEGYTRDVAQDQRSAGGVHHHEVRFHDGAWEGRVLQSNGRYHSYGPVMVLDDDEGLRRFAIAQNGGV